MSKNLVRKTYIADATFVVPAGVTVINVIAARNVLGQVSHGSAIDSAGNLWNWGNNSSGAGNAGGCADNTVTQRSSPVAVAGGRSWLQVSKDAQTCVGIDSDGNAYGWGTNSAGQAGDNSTSSRSSPTLVVGGKRWRQVEAAGDNMVVGLTTDGDVYCWGNNSAGGLGDNSTTNRSSPVLVAGSRKYKFVGGGGANYAYAIDTNDDLYAWGDNTFGNIGDNTVTNRSSPTLVVGGFKWKFIASGSRTAVGIRTDGVAMAFGKGTGTGLVGDNAIINRSSPVLVAGNRRFVEISMAGGASAIDTDGNLFGWGQAEVNGLGVARSSPTLVVGGGPKWSHVGCGGSNASLMASDGQIYVVGDNSTGMGGDNTGTDQITSPVTVVVGSKLWKTNSEEVINSLRVQVVPGQSLSLKVFANVLGIGGFSAGNGFGLAKVVIEYQA